MTCQRAPEQAQIIFGIFSVLHYNSPDTYSYFQNKHLCSQHFVFVLRIHNDNDLSGKALVMRVHYKHKSFAFSKIKCLTSVAPCARLEGMCNQKSIQLASDETIVGEVRVVLLYRGKEYARRVEFSDKASKSIIAKIPQALYRSCLKQMAELDIIEPEGILFPVGKDKSWLTKQNS